MMPTDPPHNVPAIRAAGGTRQQGALMTQANLESISPFFIVKNLPVSIAHYVERFGFQLDFEGPPGDAYYAHGGHVPIVEAGTEVVEFSPSGEYAKTMEVVAQNLAALANA